MSPHLYSDSWAFTSGLHCYRVQNGLAPAVCYATMTGKLSLLVCKVRHLTTRQHGTVCRMDSFSISAQKQEQRHWSYSPCQGICCERIRGTVHIQTVRFAWHSTQTLFPCWELQHTQRCSAGRRHKHCCQERNQTRNDRNRGVTAKGTERHWLGASIKPKNWKQKSTHKWMIQHNK